MKTNYMKQKVKSYGKRTVFYPAYKYFQKWVETQRQKQFERSQRKRGRQEFWRWSAQDQKLFDFYKQFISEGVLVFDVGANMGNRSKVFYTLGARVVAVEPQVSCAEHLISVFRNKTRFHLVNKALGATAGFADMMISNAHTISSLSSGWVQSVKKSGRFAEYEWNQNITVELETLDALIKQYGSPVFVKIDVEGFEDQVLGGLTSPIKALSLEYTPEFMGCALNCVGQICRLGDYRFQLSFGESLEFALPEWVGSEEITRILSEYSTGAFGDLYARLNECP